MSLIGAEPPGDERSKTAVVVGAGVAGLYAALRLARSGYAVEVYEASDRVGGLVESLELRDETVVELGPSHHLGKHTKLAGLLRYGGACFEEFNPPATSLVDGLVIETQDAEKELFNTCEIPEQTLATCVAGTSAEDGAKALPWWGELKHFRRRHARPASLDGQAYRVRAGPGIREKIGYQGVLNAAAERLCLEFGVRFFFGAPVKGYADLLKSRNYDRTQTQLMLAVPPAALGRTEWSALVNGSADGLDLARYRGWKSIRVFAHFPSENNEVLNAIFASLKNRHVVSRVGLFHWAVVVSPRTWLLSYTDAEQAQRVMADLKHQGGRGIWDSFVGHLERCHGIEASALNMPTLRYREAYERDAYHTLREGAGPSRGAVAGGFLRLNSKVRAVGEAYGPPELHAWMEGACASAEAAVADVCRYPLYVPKVF